MHTTLFEDQGVAAVRTTLSLYHSTILDILLERTLHTHFPRVDGLGIHLEGANHLDNLVNRHTIAQDTRDEFRIVPELFVELVAQALHGSLEATRVDKLEVITLGTVLLYDADNLTFGHRLRQSVSFGLNDTHAI